MGLGYRVIFVAIIVLFIWFCLFFTMLSIMAMKKIPVIKELQGNRRREHVKGVHFV